ncbi:RDD family protein [Roseibacterium sp. SDUM158016]|uniref:RDD family protein n=1 Tax=Roseicyclus sediminis TaxID=2980997 RepID=UPI0021D3EA4C|nr:RDD family protein [Roseibacterium sp. SDUM158016]MCU4653546.1 RDD family protein [Roseibacterium sp. SDUM158016]
MTLTGGLPDPEYDHAFYDGVPAKRFFAWVVDVLIISAISLVLGLLTLTVLLWVWPILYFTVSFLYRSATIGTGSATLGMRLMNIELRNALGHRFTGGEAMVHTGLYLVLSASMILQIISVGLMAATQRHQGLHDHILGTAAINRPR